MKVIEGDLWRLPADARVILTNGTVAQGKYGATGRGMALRTKQLFPFLELKIGVYLQRWGNHTGVLIEGGAESDSEVPVVVLPIKHQWEDFKPDWELIQRSLHELVALTTLRGWQKVMLPRPGCEGKGPRLYWIDIEDQVGEILAGDRFYVVEPSSTRGNK